MKIKFVLFLLFVALGAGAANADTCAQGQTEIPLKEFQKNKDLHCKKISSGAFGYNAYRDVDATYSIIDGVHAYQVTFYNSDFRYSAIKSITGGFWEFEKCDFRFADISAIDLKELEGYKFEGSVFNNETKLPFSRQEAIAKGMGFLP